MSSTQRLVAALLREGVGQVETSGRLGGVALPSGRLEVELARELPFAAWVRPADLGGIRLDGAPIEDPATVLERLPDLAEARRRRLERELREAASAVGQDSRDPFDPGLGRPERLQLRIGEATSGARAVGAWSARVGRWIGAGVLPRVPLHPDAEPADASLGLRPVDGTLPARRAAERGLVTPDGLDVALRLAVPGRPLPADEVEGAVALSALVQAEAPEALRLIRDLGGLAVGPGDGALGALVREPGRPSDPAERWSPVGDLGALLPQLAGLDRPERLLAAWSGLLFEALLPLLERGIALPASGASLLCRVRGGRLQGFAVSSLSGARVHQATLGSEVPDVAAAGSFADVVSFLHGHLVDGHLVDLVAALGLGVGGFAVVRRQLDRVGSGTLAHRALTELLIAAPCPLRSRLEGEPVRRDLPNPLA